MVGLKKTNNILCSQAEIAQAELITKLLRSILLSLMVFHQRIIAIRTNTPKEVVEAYMAGSSGVIRFETAIENLKNSVKWIRNTITTLDDAKEALFLSSISHLSWGNVRKNLI